MLPSDVGYLYMNQILWEVREFQVLKIVHNVCIGFLPEETGFVQLLELLEDEWVEALQNFNGLIPVG